MIQENSSITGKTGKGNYLQKGFRKTEKSNLIHMQVQFHVNLVSSHILISVVVGIACKQITEVYQEIMF